MKNRNSIIIFLIALMSAPVAFTPRDASAAEATSPQATELETLAVKYDRAAATASEADIVKLMTLARDAGQPYRVVSIVKGYLGANSSPSKQVLALAAENATLTADYRLASSRYKALVKANGNGPEASLAAAALYMVTTDYLNDVEDAYQFMREFGVNLRQTPQARRFDSWFLTQARARNDLASQLRWMTSIMAGQLPLEMEQFHFWDDLDAIIAELRSKPVDATTLAAGRDLPKLVRGDNHRRALLAFYLAVADARIDAKKVDPLVAAARDYFNARPTAAVLVDIMEMMGPGWEVEQAKKQQMFVEAFGKLGAEDKVAVVTSPSNFQGRAATTEQWVNLLANGPRDLRRIPMPPLTDKPEMLKRQAALLKDLPLPDAAVVNSLAAADNIEGMLRWYFTQETWHLPMDQVGQLIGPIWEGTKKLHAGNAEKTADRVYWQAIAKLGSEHVARSPIAAFDHGLVAHYLDCVWRTNDGQKDKAAFIAALESVMWIPVADRERHRLAEYVSSWVRGWADPVRKSKDPADDAAKKQAETLQAMITRLRDERPDPAKAPTPLCQKVSAALLAQRENRHPDHARACQEIYALVREHDSRKIPHGSALLRYSLTTNDKVEVGAFLSQVVKDQMATFNQHRFDMVNLGLFYDRRWAPWELPVHYKENGRALAVALAEVVLQQINRNQFEPQTFNLMRQLRWQRHWKLEDVGNDVVEAMIAKKTLMAAAYRPWPETISASMSYARLVRDEFPKLAAKYPIESAFDDMFVEEATKTRFLDLGYWSLGRDEKRKIVNAAATILQSFDRVPLGNETDMTARYNRDSFMSWHDRATGADANLRDALLSKIEGFYGKTRYDEWAMGRQYFVAATKPDRKEYFTRLAAYIEKIKQQPARVAPPGMGPLSAMAKPEEWSEAELNVLVTVVREVPPQNWWGGAGYDYLATHLVNGLMARQRQTDLIAVMPQLWLISVHAGNHGLMRLYTQQAEQLLAKNQPNLAAAIAESGLEIARASLPEDSRSSLTAARAQAMLGIGMAIPVDSKDPRYPIYVAQEAYRAGAFQNAWERYLTASTLVPSMIKELDPRFTIWLINQCARNQMFPAAEELARTMMPWAETATALVDIELRGQLLIAYANISLERREYPRARAQLERIVTAAEFENRHARELAELKIAEVERLMKQYDKAHEMLDRLARRSDRETQIQAFYQLARLKFDMEEYPESREFLNQVFLRAPDHVDARILEGNLDLKMKRLVEATEVKAGLTAAQQVIIPGKPLKVRLEDQNLATVGKASQVEIRVWTKGGDEETINLVPFGDSKTKFEGTLPTELTAMKKNDRILQVLGDDVIQYDFTDAFKKKHSITSVPFSLTVATDSGLAASSGKILSEAEIAEREMEAMLRERLKMEAEQQGDRVALSLIRPPDQVKPGNAINVRVSDPDRSVSSQKDKVRIRVASSSGDAIDGFELTETDTHSGVFEGAIPTASAQATAFASDTEEGRSPNFAISAGNHPHWMSLPDNKRPKLFTVDLNDNVALGKMMLTGNVPGRKLKKFRVQTSLNGEDFTTVAGWPETIQPWNGELTLSMAKMSGARDRMTLSALRDYMEVGYLRAGNTIVSMRANSLALAIDKGVMGKASELRLSGTDQYIAHLKGAFYQPSRQVRTFRVKTQSAAASRSTVMFFINGEPVAAPTKGEGPMEMKKSFGKGVHRIDLFVIGAPADEPKIEIQWDIPEEPYFATCPVGAFDTTQHPEIVAEIGRSPATLTAGKDNTEFEVVFPKDDRARVLRFVLEDFELDAPAISKIALTDAEGKKVLPTEQDLTLLTKNKVLEIIPGDRITIKYEDPVVVTKGKNIHEQYLQATYMNATVTACFPEYGEVPGDGQRSVSYVPIRRFLAGDAVAVVIQDADMDVSDKPDKIPFTVKTTGGQPVKLEALETGEHSGVFTCNIFPVAGKPERATEFQVGPSDDVIIAYMDRENHQPGVPWERTTLAEQSVFTDPQIRAYDVASRLLTEEEMAAPVRSPATSKSSAKKSDAEEEDETFVATRGLLATRPVEAVTTNVASALIDGPIFVEVLWPSVALSQRSQVTMFAQTSAGRAKTPPSANVPFDIAVPGTVRLKTGPRDAGAGDLGAGYVDLVVKGDADAISPLDDGRFCFNIPVELGEVPAESLAVEEATAKDGKPPVLAVRGGDKIFVGFQYKDKEGKEHWLTRTVRIGSDAFFDVMDRRYREPVVATHVGEKIYFRVVDKAKHVTMEKDTVTVELTTGGGGKKTVSLMETYEASGAFKGYVTFAHEEDKAGAEDMFTMPVAYGDTVTISYSPGEGLPALTRSVTIYKGADGTVLPFTKRFKDPEIAVQTQFTMAEAFFELAKKHRELGEDSLARREIAQGKKLLEEAIQDYPETGVQAQADYLLANLSLEFADMAANEEIKRRHFLESISRFTDIVANHADSPYAAKAQFKKALTFEKMGETDQACEEYVKLSYRYPDNELVAETISRLGLYFFNKGKEITDRAKAIADPIEQEKIRVQSHEVFRTAAEVFGRLSVRFPQHQMAGMSIVLSGQCYMRAEELEKAVVAFKKVVDDSSADKGARAQAMYWCGDAYMRLASAGGAKQAKVKLASGEVPLEEAYKMFTRLRWDYPETEWAKYARGRLTEKALATFAATDK